MKYKVQSKSYEYTGTWQTHFKSDDRELALAFYRENKGQGFYKGRQIRVVESNKWVIS